ncbi:MAG: DoxX family protein [Acidobacteria bacterium]|nr:DoxX family protein [Acidobacteriota bacterium]
MLHRLIATNEHDWALTYMRLVMGVVFFAHGAQKLLGWWGGYGYTGTMGFFEHQGIPATLAFLAIAAEFFGGLGLITGLLGRVAAFGISCNMVVAILTVHARNGFFMNWTGTKTGEGFEFHLLALALAGGIMILGSGAFSVDALIARAARHGLVTPRA